MKEKIFAFNFKLEKVPPACDYIGLVLLLVTIGLLSSNLKVGNEAKISLLLALVILVAAYNIEIAIMLTALSIIFIVVQNYLNNRAANNLGYQNNPDKNNY